MGSQTAGASIVSYRGGGDTITQGTTADAQALSGDVYHVYATGDLTGGDDTILSQSTRNGSGVAGDAFFVEGIAGDLGRVTGGNDVITGGSGSQATLVGDVYVQRAYSFVRGGNDIIKGSDAREFIVGDVDAVGDNQMVGGADRLWAGGGNDVVYGDFETIGAVGEATGGHDTIHGGEGDDFIFGEGGGVAKTTGGNDRLFGEAGDDIMGGGTGNDLLDGGAGRDNLQGGAGDDVYVIDDALDFVYEDPDQGIDLVKSHLGDVKLKDNFENLTFVGSGDFMGDGNSLANAIRGGAGNDYMDGRGGNDRLFGGAGADGQFGDTGDDSLNGGAGADTLVGADGFDFASYAGSEQAVKVALNGSFAATGDAVGDIFFTIEGLEGTRYNDVLAGDANSNGLFGAAGNDTLHGGNGNDAVRGGAGADMLTGGGGNDRFVFSAPVHGGDRLTDFSNATGNNDRLDFDDATFGGLPVGALASKHFVANAQGVATTADHRFMYETDTGILRYDANGSATGGVSIIATLTGAPDLTVGDFFII